jgi:hypothetical protein
MERSNAPETDGEVIVTVYRAEEGYSVYPQAPEAEPVDVLLREDVYVGTSSRGEQLLYRRHCPYGMTVAGALKAGWCRVAGSGEDEE